MVKVLIRACAFVALGVVVGCGGGSGGGGGSGSLDGAPVSGPDVQAPIFGGIRSISTAGGTVVRLDWDAATDNASAASAISYRIYASTTSGGQSYAAPVGATAPGATFVLLEAPTVALQIGQPTFFVVRAVDAAGNEDPNEVELRVEPVASGTVAFVSDTAGGTGVLGLHTDPFPTIQDGIDAVEGAGGGVVLVDSAPGGSDYVEALSFSTPVSSIALYGGFRRFSTLPAAPTAATILGSRDLAGNPTTLSGAGAFPAELVNVANTGSQTDVDGFTFDDVRDVDTALTGTLIFQPGSTKVRGVGTLFDSEVSSDDVIQLDADGVAYSVDGTDGDFLLNIDTVYRGTVTSGTATVMLDPIRALTATDADLQLSCCELNDGAFVFCDTTTFTDISSIRLIGNRAFGAGQNAFIVGGGISLLRFEGNVVENCSQPLNSETTASSDLNVASTGCDVFLRNNLIRNNRFGNNRPLMDFDFAPSNPASGGALRIRVEHNETRENNSEALHLEYIASVGDNGSVDCRVMHNLFNGASSSQIELETLSGDPFLGVTAYIEVAENILPNGDSIPIDVDVGVAANAQTTLIIRDNFISIGESEAIEVVDEEPGAPGASDQGIIRLDCLRNISLGGIEDMEFEVGVPHGGRTVLTVVENTVLSSEDEAFNVDLENYIGTTAAVYPFPDGVYCFNMFNNDLEAHDDEAIEFRDDRDETGATSIGVIYFGHGFWMNGADPSDGALRCEYRADNGGYLIERNIFGLGGADGGESALELESGTNDLPNSVRVVNNVATLASGDGIAWQGFGGQPQLINNTVAYSGQHGEGGLEMTSGQSNGDSQALVLNCIVSHSGGRDLDNGDGIRPAYSLIRDWVTPLGLGNLVGDPAYAKDIGDIVFPIDHSNLADLFVLQSTSRAVNAGHPAARFNDRDGSRNDMGAYGGPGAGLVGTKAAGTAIPFVYVATYPAVDLYTGSVLVPDTQTLLLGFTRPVDASTLAAGLSITSDGAVVQGAAVTTAGGHLVQFTPNTTLTNGASRFFEINLTTALRDTSGQSLAYAYTKRVAVQPSSATAEVEPNDDTVAGLLPADFAAAQVLGIGTAPTVFDVTGTVASATDIDVYAITVAAGDRLMATILDVRQGGGTDGEIHLDLYDTAGNLVSEGRRNLFNGTNTGTGDAYVDHMFASAGTFYLVIQNPETAAPPQSYTLRGVLDD